jgi:hypothetical protein
MVLDDYERFTLLRQDIDFYLDYAVKLAEFEHSLGVKSTYYVLLHSPFYNVLAPKSMEQIRKIEKLGHEIGWHVDTRYSFDYDERRILQDIIKGDVHSYSLHLPTLTNKPNPYMMLSCKEINLDYDIKYISDSSMNWREGCMCNHIGNHPRLQILMHPAWWIGNGNRATIIDKLRFDLTYDTNHEVDSFVHMMKIYLAEFGVTY